MHTRLVWVWVWEEREGWIVGRVGRVGRIWRVFGGCAVLVPVEAKHRQHPS